MSTCTGDFYHKILIIGSLIRNRIIGNDLHTSPSTFFGGRTFGSVSVFELGCKGGAVGAPRKRGSSVRVKADSNVIESFTHYPQCIWHHRCR